MELLLRGHDYKYAVEQLLLLSFPGERPVYVEEDRGGPAFAESSLSGDGRLARTFLRLNGRESRGEAALTGPAPTEPLLYKRETQKLGKLSFFRAARELTGVDPPWGALTGIRPGKLAERFMRETGRGEAEAARWLTEEYYVSPRRAALCARAAAAAEAVRESLAEGDISLYIGIPFCPTRCAYCSFVSHSVEKSLKLIAPYLEALHKEIAALGALCRELGLRPVSVYVGGGTPTTLSAPELAALIACLREHIDFAAVREFTVEAGRPDTITQEKLRVLRAHGVDRVSVNPQTMSDKVLENIGRRHTAADIVTALDKVRAVGGFAVNMDLIAGLPGDSVSGFRDTLEKVLTLSAENVTIHTLSLKKGSRITLDQTPLPTAREVAAMLDYASTRLTAAGYAPYYLYRQKFMSGGFENVGWQKGDTVNLYNICIMEELRSILAMGGGGSTKLIRPDGGRNIRLMAPKYPLEYVENIEKTCAEKEKISAFYRDFLKED